MNVVNIVGNLLVRLMKSMGFFWIFEKNDKTKAFIAVVFLGRLVCGLATGISSFIVPLYSKKYSVREMAPCDIYAKLGAVNQFMITFGIFLAYFSFIIEEFHFLIFVIFGFPILISFIQLALFLWVFTSETPTFLMLKNKKQEAIMLMSNLYYNNPSVADSDGMFGSLQMGSEVENMSYGDLFKNEHIGNFKLGCIVSILQQLTGINFVIYSSSQYLVGLESSNKKYMVCLIGLINFISGSSSVFLLKDRYKSFLQIGALGMTCCYLVILGLTFSLSTKTFSYCYLACLFAFIVCFEFSIGPIMWIYCADVLSDKGISLTSALNWGGALAIGGIFSNQRVVDFFYFESYARVPFFCINLFFGLACFVVRFIQTFWFARFRLKERRELIHSLRMRS